MSYIITENERPIVVVKTKEKAITAWKLSIDAELEKDVEDINFKALVVNHNCDWEDDLDTEIEIVPY